MTPDWLGACRRAAESVRKVLEEAPTSTERLRETGDVGHGGDRTLEIDALAESAILAELKGLHDEGARFSVIAEERGHVDMGDPDVVVVIDPIDGSTNAKRGLRHHAISIAVAHGQTMEDVTFGYVYDFGPREEWYAVRGEGAFLDGRRLEGTLAERRTRAGKLELVAVETADPRWLKQAGDELTRSVNKIRAHGTIAVSLCQVAAVRCDAMLTLRRSRAVDCAAAQLIVRESGGHIAFVGAPTPLGAPLDDSVYYPIVGARTEASLSELLDVPIRLDSD